MGALRFAWRRGKSCSGTQAPVSSRRGRGRRSRWWRRKSGRRSTRLLPKSSRGAPRGGPGG
eukprot:1243802-Pyramimonas_sp.AAC.1